jgi:hypothetical protein
MRKLMVHLVSCGILVIFFMSLFAPQASAILGDVTGDGIVDIGDVVYLINYLFKNGTAPQNPIDADVDGSPGINIGDVLQLIGAALPPYSCSLFPYTGVSVRVSSEIRFSADLIFSMQSGTEDTTYIKIIKNGGPDLMGMVIPLSYANQPNEVEVTLDSVSFAGSIIPTGWSIPSSAEDFIPWSVPAASIDNGSKTLLLSLFADQSTDPPLDSGTIGVVAKLYFTKIADGDPLALSVTEIPPSHQFILISSYCAGGVSPSERIFTPMLSLALEGDVNCDGKVDVGDVVYTINYLYKKGPPPCGM